jgi:hypothetical protein
VRSSKSARFYLAQCPTRFAYNWDLLEVTSRNFYALRDFLERTTGGLTSLVSASTRSAKDALGNFVTLAKDASLHKRFMTGARILDLVGAYLRIFESQSRKMSFVYPARPVHGHCCVNSHVPWIASTTLSS